MNLAVGFDDYSFIKLHYLPPSDILHHMERQLIVSHHAPDLDAIGSTWILKRFDAKKYASAKFHNINITPIS